MLLPQDLIRRIYKLRRGSECACKAGHGGTAFRSGPFGRYALVWSKGAVIDQFPRQLAPNINFFFPPPHLHQSYKMDASPCGHCLIINNVDFEPQSELSNRTGSNIDCDRLERRFKALGFLVEVRTNLKQRVRIPFLLFHDAKSAGGMPTVLSTLQRIKHELSDLSKKDHSPYDCCVVIILSHGTEVSCFCIPKMTLAMFWRLY